MRKKEKKEAPKSNVKKSVIASVVTLAGVGAACAFGALLKKRK